MASNRGEGYNNSGLILEAYLSLAQTEQDQINANPSMASLSEKMLPAFDLICLFTILNSGPMPRDLLCSATDVYAPFGNDVIDYLISHKYMQRYGTNCVDLKESIYQQAKEYIVNNATDALRDRMSSYVQKLLDRIVIIFNQRINDIGNEDLLTYIPHAENLLFIAKTYEFADQSLLMRASYNLGSHYSKRNNLRVAKQKFEEAQAIARQLDNPQEYLDTIEVALKNLESRIKDESTSIKHVFTKGVPVAEPLTAQEPAKAKVFTSGTLLKYGALGLTFFGALYLINKNRDGNTPIINLDISRLPVKSWF